MLTRLELVGFKSFADRTSFDFAPGITAIVGPNGSGKSNIVDAVKWVLGEQSAKSLRGGDMADVIFNGSSTRKSLGLAEVTMAFDNRPRLLGGVLRRPLDTDADDVEITRRVYRDGQGEYLLNGQIGRLKDLKAIFLGSGAGHGAYSVIEQGRVDALLTASTKDRRQLFEEAAGIGKFRAKKLEALRTMERVGADLGRVRDILAELDAQLRTLRAQAAKATKYRELSTQLKELRIRAGLIEFRTLQAAIDREEATLTTLRIESAAASDGERQRELSLAPLDEALAQLELEVRAYEAEATAARHAIALHDAARASDGAQLEHLRQEVLRLAGQLASIDGRLQLDEAERRQSARQCRDAEAAVERDAHGAEAARRSLVDVQARIAEIVRRTQRDREAQFDSAREATRLQAETENRQREVERLRRALAGKLAERERAQQNRTTLIDVIEELSRSDVDLRDRLESTRERSRDLERRRAEAQESQANLQERSDALRVQLSDLDARLDVLEGLERSFEGVGAGVRAVLERKVDGLLGLVADALIVPQAHAALVDLALGEASQSFVAAEGADLRDIRLSLGDIPGRVAMRPMARRSLGTARPVNAVCLADLVSVSSPEFAGLAEQLLGDCWLAELGDDPFLLSRTWPGLRWFGGDGLAIEPNGTASFGPPGAATGLLSRKSELRALRDRRVGLVAETDRIANERSEIEREIGALLQPIRSTAAELEALSDEAGTLQSRLRDRRGEYERLGQLLDVLASEIHQAESDVSEFAARAAEANERWNEAIQHEHELRERLDASAEELKISEVERDACQQAHTAAQVMLGRATAELAALRLAAEEREREVRQRSSERERLHLAERDLEERMGRVELSILSATAATANEYARKERADRAFAALSKDRTAFRKAREAAHLEWKSLRSISAAKRDEVHVLEMQVRDLHHRRDAIRTRLMDDHGIDLAALAAAPEPAGTDDDPIPLAEAPEVLKERIDDLAKKLARLGSVDLEALERLGEIEAREIELRKQHDDLTKSERSLLDIIATIDGESRTLFAATLDSVREHFRELFRKLFGGGQADIVLEPDADPLEAGIEVTARPPGKELRSLSLLSGGERTLTAIALLLAMFRSRPSPFCLLDEVDAALDEANTDRLAGALREFLDRSQFIVVTHKKRTMAMADAIYGITMQESGVSKPVSVRFEDWPEDGEVRRAA